jgi:hypothetical protein
MTPNPITTFRSALPQVLDDLLATAPRDGTTTPLPDSLAEEVAREALTCGVKPNGPPLAYVVKRLRHGLGVGDFPSPPDLPQAERDYIERCVDGALERLRMFARQDATAPDRVIPNRDTGNGGYTDPTTIGHPPNVTDLAAARRRRGTDR